MHVADVTPTRRIRTRPRPQHFLEPIPIKITERLANEVTPPHAPLTIDRDRRVSRRTTLAVTCMPRVVEGKQRIDARQELHFLMLVVARAILVRVDPKVNLL